MNGRAASSAPVPRPPFEPKWCEAREYKGEEWMPVVEAPAYFAFDDWHATMLAWIHHPERNSSSIRRAEIWQEKSGDTHEKNGMIVSYECVRRLLPRRAHLDRGLLQECTVLQDDGGHGSVVYTTLRISDQDSETPNSHILDYPRNADGLMREDMPFYHPAVRAVAFRYEPVPEPGCDSAPQGWIRVDYLLFSGDHSDLAPSSRLGRTALSLLRLMHQHSIGHASAYAKRVYHDMLVPRDAYQDLYLHLRSKYAGPVIETWQEVTDPKKHVFEDIGIAAWLLLLWRTMFPVPTSNEWPRSCRCGDVWGQPPGGFVDVGCGNGLLVHLLTQEGYRGYGLDGRSRKSWALYEQAGARLYARWLDPAALTATRDDASTNTWELPTGAFLIGNHADELTPWVPALASSTPACSGFVNIPCCAWTLQGTRFVPSQGTLDASTLATWLQVAQLPEQCKPPAPLLRPSRCWNDRLAHLAWFVHRATSAPDTSVVHSKHWAYHIYVTHLHIRSGWNLETEALRIPSSKNMAFVARVRLHDQLDTFPLPT